ncbi:MAG: UvrD-helicase domain-containing protein [Bacteroidales bacterium]
MHSELLSQLNEAQQEAVKCTEGPVIIVAGAGSGKTRTLTYRVAYIIQKGVSPFNILCLTFTNKAANEMKNRIVNLVGSEARYVWMGTFHAVCARILRTEGKLLGYTQNFSIYDTDDSKNLIKSIVNSLELDIKTYQPREVLNRISGAKNNLISPAEYINNQEIWEYDRNTKKPFIGKIYEIYQSRLFKSQSMDFDDLLFNVNILLRDFPEVLYKYQEKFKYILVDEYQDTNFSQYLIVKQLAKRYQNICVVGDDAQSIYAFRGANIQNILNFKNDYSDYNQFKLEQNYRSSSNIVKAANSIIAKNKNQIKKKIWTENEEGDKIRIVKCASDKEEGTFIAGAIFENKMNKQLLNSDFAVLYRTNAQSRIIEESLRKLNIPYRIYGGVSFYARKEIKDLLAYFRLAVNPHDEEAISRVINYPTRGIGNKTIEKLKLEAEKEEITFWNYLIDFSKYENILSPRAFNAVKKFVEMIQSFSALMFTLDAYNLAMHIAKTSGLYAHFDSDRTPEGVSRMENVESLFNAVQDYVDSNSDELTGEISIENKNLGAFMQEVSLLTDQDTQSKDDDQDKVSLMTIHQAKGLEFPQVFIAGVEENLFPSYMSIGDRDDLEEERRLFYVAVTRAEKNVVISYAETRYRWGELVFAEPSRFIDEIDKRYVDDLYLKLSETESNTPKFVRKISSKNDDVFFDRAEEKPEKYDSQVADISEIKEGIKVKHNSFGIGEVIKVEGSGANAKAKVNFKAVGVKHLLLRFAKLEIVK